MQRDNMRLKDMQQQPVMLQFVPGAYVVNIFNPVTPPPQSPDRRDDKFMGVPVSWIKGILIAVSVLGGISIVLLIEGYNTLQINPITVPESLAAGGFDGTTAATYLWNDIVKIEAQALDAPNQLHPALAESDALHADMAIIKIPDTGISLGVFVDMLREFIPQLRPNELSGSFVQNGNKLSLEIAMGGKPIYDSEAEVTPATAVATAKAMLFQDQGQSYGNFVTVKKIYDATPAATPGVGITSAKADPLLEQDNEAAFVIVRALNPYIGDCRIEQLGQNRRGDRRIVRIDQRGPSKPDDGCARL